MNPAADKDSPTVSADLSNKKKRGLRGLWLLAGIIVLFALIVGLSYGGYKVVTNSDNCVNCHEMRPEYYTWQASTHGKVPCNSCHLPLDNKQRLLRNAQGIRLLIKHFLGQQSDSILSWQPVSNENCLACHSQNRVATPSGDIKISHTNHDANGVKCINCHDGVVHGKIVERGKTNLVHPENWTKQVAETMVKSSDSKPKMIQCLTCHRKWKVSTQCERCHSKIPTPPSHQPGTWRNLHGKEAWEDVNRCSQCHYDAKVKDNFDKKQVAQYIRSNSFCDNCHTQSKPPGHTRYWLHDHWTAVNKEQIPYCIVCHDADKPPDDAPNKSPIIYCNKCHGVFTVGSQPVERITF